MLSPHGLAQEIAFYVVCGFGILVCGFIAFAQFMDWLYQRKRRR